CAYCLLPTAYFFPQPPVPSPQSLAPSPCLSLTPETWHLTPALEAQGDAKGRHVSNAFAERRWDDFAACHRRRQRFSSHDRTSRLEQQVAQPDGQASDHNSFRVQQVNENGKHRTQPPACRLNDPDGNAVSSLRGQAHIPRRERLTGLKKFGERGLLLVLCGSGNRLGSPMGYASTTRPPFGGARFVMSDRSSPRQTDVADFPRQVVSAVIKMPIRDDPGTKACSHG